MRLPTAGAATSRLASCALCLVLLAVALGCGRLNVLGTGPADALPTLAYSTSTPEPAPPTATATATASPTAAAPTPTPAPAGAAPAPGPAPDFADLGEAIASYLQASGGDAAALAAALSEWDMAPRREADLAAFTEGGAVVATDLTGDGADEIIVAATNPEPSVITGEGALLIVAREGERYRIVYDSATVAFGPGAVAILAVADANGDGVDDVAYGVQFCGAHTCSVDVAVVTHQAGRYVNLTEQIIVAYPDLIALEDVTGDGLLEIVTHGNTYGSVGAGPQRPSTMVYALEGDRYKLAGVAYDESDLLYFRVTDANIALESGDLEQAAALYEEAATDADLQPSGYLDEAEETAALRSFARFRQVVVYTMLERPEQAQAALAAAQAGAGPYAAAAEAFRQAVGQTGSVQAGCAAVAALAERSPELLDILNSYGYSNPEFLPEDLCRGAGAGLPRPQTTPIALGCPRCAD